MKEENEKGEDDSMTVGIGWIYPTAHHRIVSRFVDPPKIISGDYHSCHFRASVLNSM